MEHRLWNSFYFLFVMAILFVSCGKENSTEKPVDEPNVAKDQIVVLDETTKKIESSLSTGDHAAFLGFFSQQYAGFYKDAVQKNSQKLVQFNEVFKSRKLISISCFFFQRFSCHLTAPKFPWFFEKTWEFRSSQISCNRPLVNACTELRCCKELLVVIRG